MTSLIQILSVMETENETNIKCILGHYHIVRKNPQESKWVFEIIEKNNNLNNNDDNNNQKKKRKNLFKKEVLKKLLFKIPNLEYTAIQVQKSIVNGMSPRVSLTSLFHSIT